MTEPTQGLLLPRWWPSWFFLVAAGTGTVLLAILAYSGERARAATGRADPALCNAVREWRKNFTDLPDLQIVVTDVTFHKAPGSYVAGEGLVFVPVALAMDGAQDILDVRGEPAPARVLVVDGIRVLAWPYAGTLHRDLRFTGLTLVRRASQARSVAPPEVPTFSTLPESERLDARLKSDELEERHQLAGCRMFASWVKMTAGDPPYTAQLLRIVHRLETGIQSEAVSKRRADDVCAALRDNELNYHQAQVLAVMAMRELGVPAYGLLSANIHYLVAVFVDGPGWITIDLSRVEDGFQVGGSAIVTKAPVVGQFEAANDDFWIPAGAEYERSVGGTLFPRSKTRWSLRDETYDTTVTYAIRMDEACP